MEEWEAVSFDNQKDALDAERVVPPRQWVESKLRTFKACLC